MSVTVSYAVRIISAVTRIRAGSGLVRHSPRALVRRALAFLLVMASTAWGSPGTESNVPPAAVGPIVETNSQAMLQIYLLLKEQLEAMHLAMERNRQETKDAAAQNAETLTKGLVTIQEAFSAQRARDWETMQKTNNTVLVVAGTFAGIGFLSMLLIAYFQWRMSKGLAEISAALPAALGLGPASALGALRPPDPRQLHLAGVAESHPGLRHEPESSPQPALRHREGNVLPAAIRLFPNGGPAFQGRQIRALKTAVIVGLICAAVLALVLYLLTCGKLGFGALHAVLKI
jgi:hypothetical protein